MPYRVAQVTGLLADPSRREAPIECTTRSFGALARRDFRAELLKLSHRRGATDHDMCPFSGGGSGHRHIEINQDARFSVQQVTQPVVAWPCRPLRPHGPPGGRMVLLDGFIRKSVRTPRTRRQPARSFDHLVPLRCGSPRPALAQNSQLTECEGEASSSVVAKTGVSASVRWKL